MSRPDAQANEAGAVHRLAAQTVTSLITSALMLAAGLGALLLQDKPLAADLLMVAGVLFLLTGATRFRFQRSQTAFQRTYGYGYQRALQTLRKP